MIRQTGISKDKILSYTKGQDIKDRLIIYDIIDSTNNVAKTMIRDGAENRTIIVSNEQTAGRGRLGRNFYSPKDSGIYLSYILKSDIPLGKIVYITTAASVAVARAIEKVCGIYPRIKWVNDLYLQGKKVCGILTEAVQTADGRLNGVVVGVGINCSSVFPSELEEIAGNIPMTDDDIKNRLVYELILNLDCLEDMLNSGEYIGEYRENSIVLGKWIRILNEENSEYFVEDIGNLGELIMRDKLGNRRILSTGEVSIRIGEPI